MSENPISDALKMIPYGFYTLTSHTDDDDNIMVFNWFTQASFEPQLVAVGLQKTSHTYGLIDKSKTFTINIFRAEDQDAVKPFTKGRAKKPDKMSGVEFERAPQTQCPVLPQAAAFIECKVVGKLETGGDHDIILGEVINAEVRTAGKPADSLTLVDIGWNYAG